MKTILIGLFEDKILETLTGFDLDIEIVGVLHTSKNALLTVSGSQPDIVFLNLDLPDMAGLALLEQLTAQTQASIITTSEWDTFARDALRLGAVAFVSQPLDTTALCSIFENIDRENRREKTNKKKANKMELKPAFGWLY